MYIYIYKREKINIYIYIYVEYIWARTLLPTRPSIFLIYSTYIYICPKYFPYIFLCMFRNLFSQQILIKLLNRGIVECTNYAHTNMNLIRK